MLGADTPVPFVDVIFSKDRAEWTATSDDAGNYSLPLQPGRFAVRAIGDGVMAIDLPALVIESTAKTYDLSVVRHSVIRGHARYLDKSPAQGALVVPQLERKSSAGLSARGELGSAEVEANGRFELFTVGGNIILHGSDGTASGRVSVGNLKAGEERERVELVLIPNGFVAGIVRDPSGAAVAGARVLASVQIPGTGEYDRIPVTTDRDGHFRWQVLRPAHTIVEAAGHGYAQSAPQDFTLAPGEHRENIELVLHNATYSLVGYVVDTSGEPLPYVEVAQGHEGSKARYEKSFTDAAGRFEFTSLGPGPHRLRARKTGYEQTRLRQVSAPANDLRIVMPLE